jgi:hypothetical protein
MFIMYYSPHSHARCSPLRILGHEDVLGMNAALHAGPPRDETKRLVHIVGMAAYTSGAGYVQVYAKVEKELLNS